jgi:6-phosphogluconolactonase (cycloisomerase 2 family)
MTARSSSPASEDRVPAFHRTQIRHPAAVFRRHISRRTFLTSSTAATAGALLAQVRIARAAKAEKTLIAYVGTYSSPLQNMRPTQVDLPPGNGRGIHLFEIDRATGAMTPRAVVEMGTSPSCLAFNPPKTHLYSGNETERVGDDEAGTVSAFSVDGADGSLKLLNTVTSGGKGPAHLSVHPSGKFAFVANYFGGSIAVLPILADGRLGKPTDIKKDAGEIGPKKATSAPSGSFAISGHDAPHAHMIEADPAGKFVVHVNLGLDRIYVWRFDTEGGALSPNDPPFVSLPAGDGPRHFVFHPNGRWFYSVQEEGSTVVVFDYDAQTGRLASRQTVSTLPPRFAGSNFCSEIALSHDARFLYVGNRLHDTIAIFRVGNDGTLRYIGEEWTRGDYPRSFAFEPAGHFLFCCNQRADHIAVFRVEKESGKLQFTGHYAGVGNPSVIVFRETISV